MLIMNLYRGYNTVFEEALYFLYQMTGVMVLLLNYQMTSLYKNLQSKQKYGRISEKSAEKSMIHV